MRGSVIAASIVGIVNIGYTWVLRNGDESATTQLGKDFLKTGGFIVLMGALSFIKPLAGIVDILSYVYIGIIVLNNGSDILESIGGI